MIKTIWKFPLSVADEQEVLMPRGAEILCVQAQNDVACLWAKVDPGADKAARTIVIAGTGHPFEERPSRYIGTFQIFDGSLVFHVFELLP